MSDILDGFQGVFPDGCEFVHMDIAGLEDSCKRDDLIDLADIFAVLDVFGGIDHCYAGAR